MSTLSFPKLDSVINTFFQDVLKIECTAHYDNDFAYWYAKSEITYGLLVDEQATRFFEFAKGLGLKYDCGTFILSLMHEVGHDQTLDSLTDAEFRKSEKAKKKLQAIDSFEYFNLPDEIIATKWAVDYINNHKDILAKFAKDVQKAMQDENIEYLTGGTE